MVIFGMDDLWNPRQEVEVRCRFVDVDNDKERRDRIIPESSCHSIVSLPSALACRGRTELPGRPKFLREELSHRPF